MGLNFYGRDFSRAGVRDVLGHDYNASLERQGATLHWDEAYREHRLDLCGARRRAHGDILSQRRGLYR